MLRNVKLRWLSMLCIAALALGGLENSALAQKVPFKVTGGGSAPEGLSIDGEDSNFNVTGTGTHLGKYSGDAGIAIVTSFADGEGTFKGSFDFVAANGDILACTLGDTGNGAESDGIFFPVPVGEGLVSIVFCAEFNPIPSESTGRFKNVIDGSFTVLAMTEPIELVIDGNGFTPPFELTWEGEGWLEFDRGK